MLLWKEPVIPAKETRVTCALRGQHTLFIVPGFCWTRCIARTNAGVKDELLATRDNIAKFYSKLYTPHISIGIIILPILVQNVL